MGMEQLGRSYNLGTSATTANTRFNLKNHAGVTFVLIGATSGNMTIQEHNASSSGTSQNLSAITRYYTQASGVWTKVTQAAAATATAVTGGLLAVYVPATALSDGFSYISASHASGSFVVILGEPVVQRAPANLASVTA